MRRVNTQAKKKRLEELSVKALSGKMCFGLKRKFVFRTEAEVVDFVLNDADARFKYVEYLSKYSSKD